MAALAYRTGQFDLAARLALRSASPTASWVKAKLALQEGKLVDAAGFYATALRALSEARNDLDEVNQHRLTGESGVLALARGDYIEALRVLYTVALSYWGDVAYVAERVLTVDELKAFVDTEVPNLSLMPREDDERIYAFHKTPKAELRDLIARRLVRSKRYQEALSYFVDRNVAAQVRAYAQALTDAETSWRRADRARAWYTAAVLARQFGMEMMGYEAHPDFFVYEGNFDQGLGHRYAFGEFVTEGEEKRFSASALKVELRFHYRYLAVSHAQRAADLLPRRSEAFAAVLCKATGWMFSTQETAAKLRAGDLYDRYLKEGAYLPWAAEFGRRCPEPNFDAAARFTWTQSLRDGHRFARRYGWAFLVAFAAVGSAGFILFVRRRRVA